MSSVLIGIVLIFTACFASATIEAPNLFLERFQLANPNFSCSWIIIQNHLGISTHRALYWNFLQNIPTSMMILKSNIKKQLHIHQDRIHFTPFCNFVVVLLDIHDIPSFADLIKVNGKWAELVGSRFETRLFNNFYLFVNISPLQSQDYERVLLTQDPFPLWFPLKAFVHWNLNGFQVITLCWHCNEHPERKKLMRKNVILKQLLMEDFRYFDKKKFQLSQLFPDYTTNLMQLSLLATTPSENEKLEITCTKVEEHLNTRLFWKGGSDDVMMDLIFVHAFSVKLNFTCRITMLRNSDIKEIAIFTRFQRLLQYYHAVEYSGTLGKLQNALRKLVTLDK